MNASIPLQFYDYSKSIVVEIFVMNNKREFNGTF